MPPGTPVLRTLGAYVSEMSFGDLSPDTVAAAQLRLLDYLGTALHASGAEPWRPMATVLGAYGGAGEATVIGGGGKRPCAQAAMLNTYPHMSEGSRWAGGHCAWVAMPAALAATERAGGSGEDLILAIVAAYEVMLRVGAVLYPEVHRRGFQPTTVRGPMGAAAAAGTAWGLDTERTVHALAIAASQGSGLEAAGSPWPFYCFQVGRATEAGVLAALAAEAGLAGSESILEDGYLEAFGGPGVDPERIVSDLGRPRLIETTYLKLHFGCRHAHPLVDTCLDLMARHDLRWQEIASLRLRTYPTALAVCDRMGAGDAHFDIRAVVATAVVHGDAAMHRFSKASLGGWNVRDVMARITMEADPEMERTFPATWPAAVELTTRDGCVLAGRRDLPRGEPEDPYSPLEVEEKFHALAAGALPVDARRELVELIRDLPRVSDLHDMLGLLGQRRPAR